MRMRLLGACSLVTLGLVGASVGHAQPMPGYGMPGYGYPPAYGPPPAYYGNPAYGAPGYYPPTGYFAAPPGYPMFTPTQATPVVQPGASLPAPGAPAGDA